MIFPGVLIIAIDPNTGIGMKTPLPYEGFSYSSIVTNVSLGKKLNLWKTTKTARNAKKIIWFEANPSHPFGDTKYFP